MSDHVGELLGLNLQARQLPFLHKGLTHERENQSSSLHRRPKNPLLFIRFEKKEEKENQASFVSFKLFWEEAKHN